MEDPAALFRQAVEAAIARQNRQILEHERRTVELARLIQTNHGEAMAAERLLMTLAALVARREPDPLAFCEQLREIALDGMPKAQTAGIEAGREALERALSKIEAFIVKASGQA